MKRIKIAIVGFCFAAIIGGWSFYNDQANDKMLMNNVEALTAGDHDYQWLKIEKHHDIVSQSISSVTKAGGITVTHDSISNDYSFSLGAGMTQNYTDDADIRCTKYYCGGIGLYCDDANSGILTVNIHTGKTLFIPKSKFGEGFNNMN